MMDLRAALLSIVLLAVPAVHAQTPEAFKADYDRLQQWRFRTEAVAVPAGGVSWTVEGATWTFESGRIWFEEPTSGGAVTGLVFEGRGRFLMAVPDESELVQLRRFAKKPDLSGLDEVFTSMVLRTSGELPLSAGETSSATFTPHKLARERHEQWLTQRFFDVDSRIVKALATPGDRYLRADMETGSLGWLAWDYDAERIEEIHVESFNTRFPALEVWVSLDKPADRDPRGGPTSRFQPEIDIQHVDIAVDLTEAGRDEDWMKGRFKTGVEFLPQRDGARAVTLYLDNFAKVTSVSEKGRALPFLRDPIGSRRRTLDNRIFDASLVVPLEKPVVKGERRRLDIEYEMDVKNYAAGREWYPSADGEETILPDAHTARLEVTVRKKFEVRAVGHRDETANREDGKASTSVWISEQPVKMLTFSFSDRFHEERVEKEGVPPILCFGSKVEVSRKGRFREVGEDVAGSLGFFEDLLEARLPDTPIYVTSIAGFHGQAFDGFIQLAEESFDILGPGSAELFRAHEAAHQFWGVLVGAQTYRDAWLGEAFAEYSGMMYVETTMKNGPALFDEILRAYNDEQNGSIKSGFSKFTRMGVNLQNRAYGDRIGPIGHGWRANTGELPTAYSSQVYGKGALVLHMLRGILRDETGTDQAFTDVLRDFFKTHRGGLASTRDFEAAVARRVPGDWSWFFDEWVRGTAIPSYRWSATISAAPEASGQHSVVLKVRQSDVPGDFKMSVPVEVTFADGRTERRRVMVDQAEKSFTLGFAEKPKGVVFNPGGEVLAKVSGE